MKLSSCIIAVILSLISPICFAQSLDAIEKADKEVLEVWNATALTFRRAIFVSEEPAGFGSYTDRDSNAFKQGEPLIIYSEPVGYAWREKGDGSYTIGFAMDLAIKKANGDIIAGKENFGRKEVVVKSKAREFMLYATVDITGAPPGSYVVGIRVRDLASDEFGVISLPFRIVE